MPIHTITITTNITTIAVLVTDTNTAVNTVTDSPAGTEIAMMTAAGIGIDKTCI
jgi:hypothetical protein